MEKHIITDHVPIKEFYNLENEIEIPYRDFNKILEKLADTKDKLLGTVDNINDIRVQFYFSDDPYYDNGFLAIDLIFDRLETDVEFEKRKKEAEESERNATALLEADKQNRISEAKKLLEENGYVVAR